MISTSPSSSEDLPCLQFPGGSTSYQALRTQFVHCTATNRIPPQEENAPKSVPASNCLEATDVCSYVSRPRIKKESYPNAHKICRLSTYHQALVVAPFQDRLGSLIDRLSDACHAAGPLHSVILHPEWYRGVRSRATELPKMPLKASSPQPCRVMAAISVDVSLHMPTLKWKRLAHTSHEQTFLLSTGFHVSSCSCACVDPLTGIRTFMQKMPPACEPSVLYTENCTVSGLLYAKQDLCLELPSVRVCSPLMSSGRACKQMLLGMYCLEQLAHSIRLCQRKESGMTPCGPCTFLDLLLRKSMQAHAAKFSAHLAHSARLCRGRGQARPFTLLTFSPCRHQEHTRLLIRMLDTAMIHMSCVLLSTVCWQASCTASELQREEDNAGTLQCRALWNGTGPTIVRLSVGLGLQMCVLESLKEALQWRHAKSQPEGE